MVLYIRFAVINRSLIELRRTDAAWVMEYITVKFWELSVLREQKI